MKVNLGCGHKYMIGWWNVDCDPSCKVDEYSNLNQPLKDKHEYFWADNVLEHLSEENIRNIHASMKEDAILEGIVPHVLGREAFNEFQHCRWFHCETFKISRIFQTLFTVEYLDIAYRYFGIGISPPLILVKAHEKFLPGILPPTRIHFKLRKK